MKRCGLLYLFTSTKIFIKSHEKTKARIRNGKNFERGEMVPKILQAGTLKFIKIKT